MDNYEPYCISKNNEPTCQEMFSKDNDDDCIIPYLKFNRPVSKYRIYHNNRLYDAYILSKFNPGKKVYDIRNIQDINELQITCEIFELTNVGQFVKTITRNKEDYILK